jgi:hypothetical protein
MSDDVGDNNEVVGSRMTERKISLQEQENELLEKLAEDNYGGNCSQTVRSAVRSYERIQNGGGEARRQRIEHEVNRIGEAVDQLTECFQENEFDSTSDRPVKETGKESVMATGEKISSETTTSSRNMQLVYRVILREYPDTISIDEIVSLEELSETEIRHALVELEMEEEIEIIRINGTSQVAAQTESPE